MGVFFVPDNQRIWRKPFKQSLESLMEHTCKHYFILKQVFNIFFLTFALWFHVVQGDHIYTRLCNNSAFSGIECPLVSVFIKSKIFFLKDASLNKTKNGFEVIFLLSMQLISRLLSRCALDVQLVDSFYIRICMESFGNVSSVHSVCCPVYYRSGNIE